jgi:hypothetical protein
MNVIDVFALCIGVWSATSSQRMLQQDGGNPSNRPFDRPAMGKCSGHTA